MVIANLALGVAKYVLYTNKSWPNYYEYTSVVLQEKSWEINLYHES